MKVNQVQIFGTISLTIFFFLVSVSASVNSQSNSELFDIRIGTVQDVLPGSTVVIPVTLYNAPHEIGRFEFLISYDPSLLSIEIIRLGSAIYSRDPDSSCRWYGLERNVISDADCGGSPCPTRTIRVVNYAESQYYYRKPNCYSPPTPAELLTLKFRVTNNYEEHCQFTSIKFVWNDCADNFLAFDSSLEFDTNFVQIAAANRVFSETEIIPPADTYPSYGGPLNTCTINWYDTLSTLDRIIDFHNGGVSIKCLSHSVQIGDIDLDGLPYTADDTLIFRNYFLYGDAAFDASVEFQTAASDINRDGVRPKLEDFKQLSSIVRGELDPDYNDALDIRGENYVINDLDLKTVYLKTTVPFPAIWLKFSGKIEPHELAQVDDLYHFDGEFTRMLFEFEYPEEPGEFTLFNYNGEGELVDMQAATHVGGEINGYYLNCEQGLNCRRTKGVGDININGVAYEVADAVLFMNYFVYGEQVFTKDREVQIYNTDINLDYSFLGIADLAQIMQIIVGDALPFVQDSTMSKEVIFYPNSRGTIEIRKPFTDPLGAVFLLVEGQVEPRLLQGDLDMEYAYDGNLTRILITNDWNGWGNPGIDEGDFVDIGGNKILEVSTATYQGIKVNSVISSGLPFKYSLNQNFPNPFNNGTTITLALPRNADVSLEIINILGQVVYKFKQSNYEAGIVRFDWNATDNSGQEVASGIYFYRVKVDNFVLTKKMMLLK